jgi:hypothetical protein
VAVAARTARSTFRDKATARETRVRPATLPGVTELEGAQLAWALLHVTGTEENMTSIKTTIEEWGYPAAVLISWMMATAYTLSKII